MAVLKRDEFFTKLHERIGTDTSEDALSFIEDMSDTYDELERRANGDGEDWEKKYHDLDEAWKTKYKNRFFHGGSNYRPDFDNYEEDEPKDKSEITVKELFN